MAIVLNLFLSLPIRAVDVEITSESLALSATPRFTET